jgi:SAM-dependent methyltransferase
LSVHFRSDAVTLHHGDCLDVIRGLADNSIDSVVTDPPYGLNFMGKHWDDGAIAFNVVLWKECLRVLKPGGHLVAFGGTRTWHRLAVAIEDAGFEIRDNLAWLYGSGFPKSLDVGKAIDKKRDDVEPVRVVCRAIRAAMESRGLVSRDLSPEFDCHPRLVDHWAARDTDSQPSLPKWDQWLKLKDLLGLPDDMDAEVWRLNGRKGTPGEAWGQREVVGAGYRLDKKQGHVNYGGGTPEGNYDITAPATDAAKQWHGWGTALKPAFEPIVLARKPLAGTVAATVLEHGTGALNIDACRVATSDRWPGTRNNSHKNYGADVFGKFSEQYTSPSNPAGRWPANALLDDHAAALVDEQSGVSTSRGGRSSMQDIRGGKYGSAAKPRIASKDPGGGHNDSGGASRFFPVFRYNAKAPTKERPDVAGVRHPTVKPLALMQWLVRLITPPGGIVLEPFAGSGTTVEACMREGFNVVAIEREAEYLPLIEARIARASDV